MKNITPEQWQTQLQDNDNALIIDARTPQEWSEGVQEHAILMDIMDLESFIENAKQLDNSKYCFVYCRSGVRSAKACQELEKIGFEETFNLIGGMLNWQGKVVIPNLN